MNVRGTHSRWFVVSLVLAGCGIRSSSGQGPVDPLVVEAEPPEVDVGEAADAGAEAPSPAPVGQPWPGIAERIEACVGLEPNESPPPPCPGSDIDPLRSEQCNPQAHRFWTPADDREPLATPPALLPSPPPLEPGGFDPAGPAPTGPVDGGLSRQLIVDWFQQHQAELACCAAMVPGTEGRLAVQFIFGGGRDHPEVSVAESEVDPAVAECVVGVMSEWVWGFGRACDPCTGQANGWEAVTMGSYPLVFRQPRGL